MAHAGPTAFAFKAFAFDMDGILVDTDDLWTRTKRHAADRTNLRFCDLDPDQEGSSLRTFASALIEANGIPLGTSLIDEFESHADAYALDFYKKDVALIDGALRAVTTVREAGALTAICSNCPHVFIEAVLDRFDLRPLFNTVVSCHALGAPKPDPAGYLAACYQLGVLPQDTAVIEDTTSGVTAAFAAGAGLVVIVGECEASVRRRYGPKLIQVRDMTALAYLLKSTSVYGNRT